MAFGFSKSNGNVGSVYYISKKIDKFAAFLETMTELLCLVQSCCHYMVKCNPIWLHFAGTDDDLEYYVRECGDILGVTTKLKPDTRDAKHILEYII